MFLSDRVEEYSTRVSEVRKKLADNGLWKLPVGCMGGGV